jgi:hypothetical protein
VLPRVSAEVGYNRRWFNGFTVTDNRATVASDYDLFSFTAPTASAIASPVAGQTITAYNPDPTIAASNNPYVTFADDYGKTIQYWHGVDVNVNARIRNGLTLQGGTSTGRGVRDNCEVTAKLPELLNVLGTWAASRLLPRRGAVADAGARSGGVHRSEGGCRHQRQLPVQARDARRWRQRHRD